MDVREITVDSGRSGGVHRRDRSRRRTKGDGVVQRGDRLAQRSNRIEFQAFDDSRFAAVWMGKEQSSIAIAPRCRGNRQYAARGLNAAVERQLAEQEMSPMSRRLTTTGGRQHAKRDRQIEDRTGLADVCRREIHGNAMGRELEPRIP